MQEKHLFEYAVIRLVPSVEREEFMNVGVIVYCASQGFLQTIYELNKEKAGAFSATLDLDELQERLRAFQRVCEGGGDGGAIGQQPLAARFRWLTATRSTVVQCSAVHPGLCTDAPQTLARLHQQLVR